MHQILDGDLTVDLDVSRRGDAVLLQMLPRDSQRCSVKATKTVASASISGSSMRSASGKHRDTTNNNSSS